MQFLGWVLCTKIRGNFLFLIHLDFWRDAQAIRKLFPTLSPFFATIPQAKTGKIVRCLLDDVSKIPGQSEVLITLCKESIDWAEKEERNYLRLHLESKLASALFQVQQYEESLKLVKALLKEVKKQDDKHLLSSIFLLESKIHHQLQHLPKSRVKKSCFNFSSF